MGIPWDWTGMNCNAMGWDRKICPKDKLGSKAMVQQRKILPHTILLIRLLRAGNGPVKRITSLPIMSASFTTYIL